jgi:hypothetical protein
MGTSVADTAARTALSISRRVVVTSELSNCLTQARHASEAFAQKLDRRNASVSNERKAALIALAVLIEELRLAEPSDSTRALGLAW